MIITPKAANHAADMIDGIVSHPFWGGIDKEALATVRDALRSGSVQIEDPDEEVPDWGIPGDYMVYTGIGGYESQREHASKTFEKGVPYLLTRTEIGRSSSSYTFEGIKGTWNTVMFDYADPAAILEDWNTNRIGRKMSINDCNEYMGYDIYDINGTDDD